MVLQPAADGGGQEGKQLHKEEEEELGGADDEELEEGGGEDVEDGGANVLDEADEMGRPELGEGLEGRPDALLLHGGLEQCDWDLGGT